MSLTFVGKQLAEVRGRAYGQCCLCFRRQGAHAHHRRKKAMGGSTAWDTNLSPNGVWLCSPCHDWVHAHRVLAEDLGLLLPMGTDPVAEPVWLFLPYGRRWYELTPDGPRVHDGRERPDSAVLALVPS